MTLKNKEKVVVVANGEFPFSEISLKLLKEASYIVCCDGAANKLDENNFIPDIIIGDLDSVEKNIKEKFFSKIIQISEQNTNDLSKAISWLKTQGIENVDIIGATGLREDHFIANVFLLLKYHKIGLKAVIWGNYGKFSVVENKAVISSYKSQQVSIFSTNKAKITSQNLKYPLENTVFNEIWQGSLNESLSSSFTIFTNDKPIIIYQKY